jgi:starch-binding outer membrane protein, SusD/RagB family
MRSISSLRGRRRAFLLLPLLAAALACSEITSLDQNNPGQILAEDAYVPANANLLVNGAIGDFECAFHRYVVSQALLGDELVNAFANAVQFDWDRRTMPTSHAYGTTGCGATTSFQLPGHYTPLSVARATADTILARLQEWTDAEMPTGINRQQLIGRAANYAGYSLVLLGESMCSAAINLGPELSKAQLWEEAKLRFDVAVTAATAANDNVMLNMARVGRARTLLNLGQVPAAGADAAAVPAGFAVNAAALATGNNRQQNVVFIHTRVSNYSSVDPSFVGLTFGGVPDPRVTVNVTTTIGTNGFTPIRQVMKYADRGAPIPIASTDEARLIQAEALVAAGNLQGAVDIINALHTAVGIPAYNGAGQTAAQVKAQVVEERRRELFMEGHRLGDMNRYTLPRLPADGTPFPNGGVYSAQACPGANAAGYPFGFPLPDVERLNNPNIP